MTKEQVKVQLLIGKTLAELFTFTRGDDDCLIYKSNWNISDEIIYIPDLSSWWDIHKPVPPDKVDWILQDLCTASDFLEACKGNSEQAKHLFEYCNWQHPEVGFDC